MVWAFGGADDEPVLVVQAVDEVGQVVKAVLVASCLAQLRLRRGTRSGAGHAGRPGHGRGLLPEDGAAETLPGPLAHALEVAGCDRLGLQGSLDQGGLPVEVVGGGGGLWVSWVRRGRFAGPPAVRIAPWTPWSVMVAVAKASAAEPVEM